MTSMIGRNYKLMLYLTTFFRQVDVGSCLLSAPSRYHYHFSPLRPSCMGLANIIDGITDDYDVSISDSFSSASSEWESSDYLETNDVTGLSVGFEEANNRKSIAEKQKLSEEDIWIQNIVDEIHNVYSTLDDQPLYDTSFDEPSVDRSIEDSIHNNMDDEIAMLVRCNERPDSLLIEEGRALPPLSNEEKNDVSQLVVWNKGTFEATEFLKYAVSKMFREHATPSVQDGILSMNRACIASWMTKSLHEEEEGRVSQHDRRVLKTLSDFSEYGSGRIVEENFHNLYLHCIVGDASNLSSLSANRHLQFRKEFRDAVWRDICAHGILSPVEDERLLLLKELDFGGSELTIDGRANNSNEVAEQVFMDECEILDWDYRAPELKEGGYDEENYRRASSHKLVDMSNDKSTPLRIRDGDFVFIDEESCIGCMQCVNIAESSFLMMESGRARTFNQRAGVDVEQAVDACPVSCMHRVSFQELSTFETARDEGDGSLDHGGHIPLHVAGMDSDHNRRSSLYHTLKAKCVTSSNCPQKGCYDCPSYRNPGENPFFIAKHKQAEHVRAQHFIQNGEARFFRKAMDL